MFTDEFFEKEDNSKLFDFFMKFFLTKDVVFDFPKELNNDLQEYHHVPNISEIADHLKCCL